MNKPVTIVVECSWTPNPASAIDELPALAIVSVGAPCAARCSTTQPITDGGRANPLLPSFWRRFRQMLVRRNPEPVIERLEEWASR